MPKQKAFKAPKKPRACKTTTSKAPIIKPTRKVISYNYKANKALVYKGATIGLAKVRKLNFSSKSIYY